MTMELQGSEGVISVLLIEDDQRLAGLTGRYLEKRGLVVTLAFDGPTGLREATRNTYDAILLDLMLPGIGGLDLCRQIRQRSDVPIIMVTALDEEGERIVGLETGADDYVTKPFSSPELLARIRAVVRRARGKVGPSTRTIQVGKLTVDAGAIKATFDGQTLELTAYEFTILRVLAERAGRVLSRERLLDLAKGSAEEAFDRSIDGHISRLRKKLGDDPKNPQLLKTIRGAGYMLAREGTT